MTQTELNRAVARATGETVTTLSQRGFVPSLRQLQSVDV